MHRTWAPATTGSAGAERAGSPAVTGVAFVIPHTDIPSGGHVYDAAVLASWPGQRPALVELDGPWPRGDETSLRALRKALRTYDVVVLDGLVGAAHPGSIADAGRDGHRIVLLLHLPLADEGGLPELERADLERLEGEAVRLAWRVAATSRTAARDVSRRHGRADVVALPPGCDAAPAAEVHQPPGLLQVGAIGHRKNQLNTIAALEDCLDLPWTMTFVGPVADESYASRFRDRLGERTVWAGPLVGADLEAAYAGADLLLHPARAETWGLVITEALARGIPAVVGTSTGAIEALACGAGDELPGAAVDPDDPAQLARMLRAWLTDAELRTAWRTRALAARPLLRGWPEVSRQLAALVAE